MGAHLGSVGAEFGATTGRPRRCGWFDAVALRRSIINSSVSGLCVTKLDVLDGIETVRICVGYEIDGERINGLPVVVDRFADCQPIYEDIPGWSESTVGATSYDATSGERAKLPGENRRTGPNADRHHFHWSGQRADHRKTPPFRLIL